jgi:hypothetical protein
MLEATVEKIGMQRSDTLALDDLQIERFVRSIGRFEWAFDSFEDPLMYPGTMIEENLAANFFFFMVAIDHRTHPSGRTFKGIVKGTELTGAELLWALAKTRLDEDPMFFSPERLSTISVREIARLFSVAKPEPVEVEGPEERTALLRDCAARLSRNFAGSIMNVISSSEGWLIREDGKGFLQLLKQFDAYKDPLNKKSFLLVKFLERRHFIDVRDPGDLHVPVDNILLRLALRTGMVKLLNGSLDQKIRSGTEVTEEEHRMLRDSTLMAFDRVAGSLTMNATRLDDILWEFGRAHCQVPDAICNSLPSPPFQRCYRMIRSGPVGECPFGQGCAGYRKPEVWELKEPKFKTVFY